MMTASVIQFLISAGVIFGAGFALTQFADTIAQRTKFGRLLVGSLLLAGATSLPELTIGLSLVRIGAPDLALGDLMGACLLNLLILGGLDMTRYSQGQMLSRASAATALPAGISIGLVTLAAAAIFLGPKLGEITVANVGVGSLAIGVAYLGAARLIFSGQQESSASSSKIETSISSIAWFQKMGLKGAGVGFVASALVIVVTAPFLGNAAKELAEASGLGGTFFGTAFVALCTCLPEFVTTWTAVRAKAFNLAIGNIFGSNCFNMLLILPLDLFHEGSLLAAVSPTHVFTGLGVILVTTVAILGQLYQVERKRHFLEPDALLVVLLVGAALSGVYFLR